jgi:hypothetical protein
MNNCLCYPTLASVTGGLAALNIIPAGTPAVVIEQFNTSSAVSAALYIPVAAYPGHALSFENGTTWWAIHPDHITLEAAGGTAGGWYGGWLAGAGLCGRAATRPRLRVGGATNLAQIGRSGLLALQSLKQGPEHRQHWFLDHRARANGVPAGHAL